MKLRSCILQSCLVSLILHQFHVKSPHFINVLSKLLSFFWTLQDMSTKYKQSNAIKPLSTTLPLALGENISRRQSRLQRMKLVVPCRIKSRVVVNVVV
jgi:hypothetical protein